MHIEKKTNPQTCLQAIQILHVLCKELPTAFTQSLPSLPLPSPCTSDPTHSSQPPASQTSLPSQQQGRSADLPTPSAWARGTSLCASLPQTPCSRRSFSSAPGPRKYLCLHRAAPRPQQYLQTEFFFFLQPI